jgi:prepilin-type N-terminal cleavage/methylation domain-containing protein
MNRNRPQHAGFSLVELTVVLVIVALLSSGLLLGLSAQRDVTSNQEAQRQLDNIKDALLAFAITNGRLPCPAIPTLANTISSAGQEDKNAINVCNLEHGVLPWTSLGLPETDPWGQRFTYFASAKFTKPIVAPALASFTLATGVPTDPATPDDNSGTANVKATAASGSNIASDLAAVVVSHGPLGAGAYTTDGSKLAVAAGDEDENANATLTFVSRTQSGDFNDQLIWISPNQLKSRLVAVGKLP